MGLYRVLWLFLTSCCIPNYVFCVCSRAYGAKPCPYVPSAPGETPACARPGMTFCEYPTHYPSQRVKHLVEAWMYDHGTLLLDESKYELNYYAPTTKYGDNTYGPPQNNIHNEYRPEGNRGYDGSSFQGYPSNAYIPATNRNHSYYGAPNNHQSEGHKYQAKSQYPGGYNRYNQPQHFKSTRVPEAIGQNTGTWPKWSGGNSKYYTRRKRSMDHIRRWSTNSNDTETMRRRKKRQFDGPQSLCDTRTNYIMPRAALNNQGNWMYVVNMPELDNRYTQLVRSETCASTQCSGLCSLPNDYTSRCEQKYVQKRLIAVEPAGNNLYTDVFWFPSCCLCTITRTV